SRGRRAAHRALRVLLGTARRQAVGRVARVAARGAGSDVIQDDRAAPCPVRGERIACGRISPPPTRTSQENPVKSPTLIIAVMLSGAALSALAADPPKDAPKKELTPQQ